MNPLHGEANMVSLSYVRMTRLFFRSPFQNLWVGSFLQANVHGADQIDLGMRCPESADDATVEILVCEDAYH
jgi:hypothetical protein